MEIYRQTTNRVEFEAPEPTTLVTATVRLNDGEPIAVPVSGGNENPALRTRYITIPYVQNEGVVTVEWSYTGQSLTEDALVSGQVVITDTFDVVTPILSPKEILDVWDTATPTEIAQIEPAVRHIINAHTGQTFGKYVGKVRVRGANNGSLLLPRKLMRINTVNGGSASDFYDIVGDGFYLTYYPMGVPPIKADYYGLHMHRGGVIHNPNNVKWGVFEASRVYEIDGEWGYDEVPSRIKEAAKLLINDYASADTAYRDRYLTSMTAADWRIQFNSGAFSKTGNVRADQLLSDYVLQRGWAVL